MGLILNENHSHLDGMASPVQQVPGWMPITRSMVAVQGRVFYRASNPGMAL